MTPQHHLPADIERTSMGIITAELEARGLNIPPENAAVVKAPQGLNTSGCGYAVSVYRHFDEAYALLKSKNMINGKIFKSIGAGEYAEVK